MSTATLRLYTFAACIFCPPEVSSGDAPERWPYDPLSPRRARFTMRAGFHIAHDHGFVEWARLTWSLLRDGRVRVRPALPLVWPRW